MILKQTLTTWMKYMMISNDNLNFLTQSRVRNKFHISKHEAQQDCLNILNNINIP